MQCSNAEKTRVESLMSGPRSPPHALDRCPFHSTFTSVFPWWDWGSGEAQPSEDVRCQSLQVATTASTVLTLTRSGALALHPARHMPEISLKYRCRCSA